MAEKHGGASITLNLKYDGEERWLSFANSANPDQTAPEKSLSGSTMGVQKLMAKVLQFKGWKINPCPACLFHTY